MNWRHDRGLTSSGTAADRGETYTSGAHRIEHHIGGWVAYVDGRALKSSGGYAAHYSTASAAKKAIERALKHGNPAGRKTVHLRNFTGTIRKNANGTFSIEGRAKRK